MNKDKSTAAGSRNNKIKMRLYYFFEAVYAILTMRYFTSRPIDMSKPLDKILILVLVFWISMSFLLYEKEKYGKLLPKGKNICKIN